MFLSRRTLLRFAPAILVFCAMAGGLSWGIAAVWQSVTTPEVEQAMASQDTPLVERIDHAVAAGVLPGLHAVLVERGGARVAERYYQGRDQAWGRDLGVVDFDRDTLHDVRSITKSVVSLLYAIALERGEVPALDTPILDAFPDYADLASDPVRASWTVAHALDMTLGVEWNEDLPYTDPNNSEIAMERAPDRWRFILERPIVAKPGEVWRYNGGATALVGRVIEAGTGTKLPAYAAQHLFGPLGITEVEWIEGGDGTASAASGLRLSAPDLLKIGTLILRQGMWRGSQIVPSKWIAALATPTAQTDFGMGYSRSWYVSEQPLGSTGGTAPMISAAGNGGQRLFVLPTLDLVAVMYCGRYSLPDQWINPLIVLQRLILADA